MNLPYIDARLVLGDGEVITLNPDDQAEMQEAARNPIELASAKTGYSVSKIQAWLLHLDERGQCTGLTASGIRCRDHARDYYDLSEFEDGISNRCFRHKTSVPYV